MAVDPASLDAPPEGDLDAVDGSEVALPASDDGNDDPAEDAAGSPITAEDELARDDAPEDDDASVEPGVVINDDPYDMLGEHSCPTCGGAGQIPYGVLQSPRYQCCHECGGVGQVLTGSLVSENAMQICENCNGGGFEMVPGQTGVAPLSNMESVDHGEPPWPGAIFDHTLGAWTTATPRA